MTTTTPATTEELYLFQDGAVEDAKRQLISNGAVVPLALIMCSKMELGPWLRNALMDLHTGSKVPEEVLSDTRNMKDMVLVVPCSYGSVDLVLHMLKYISEDPEKTAETFDMLKAHAPLTIDPKEVSRTILNSLKRQLKLNEKDIVATFLKKVCKETKAYAIIKIDEAWMATFPKKEGQTAQDIRDALPESLGEVPGRKECIQVILETQTFRRYIVAPFSRANAGDGKKEEIVWEEKHVMDDTAENQHLSGRFSGFLMPPPEESPLTKTETP